MTKLYVALIGSLLTVSVFANPFRSKFDTSKQKPTKTYKIKKKEICKDFTGEWIGTCIEKDENGDIHERDAKLSILQTDCKEITFDNQPFSIGGTSQESSNTSENQMSTSFFLDWNLLRNKINVSVAGSGRGFAKFFKHLFFIKGTSILYEEEDALIIKGDTEGTLKPLPSGEVYTFKNESNCTYRRDGTTGLKSMVK